MEDVVTGTIIMVPGIGCMVEIDFKITLEEGEITVTEVVIEIIDPTIGIAGGLEIGTATEMVIDTTATQITEGKTVVKDMVVEIKIKADLEIEIGGVGVAPEKVPNPEAVPRIGMTIEGRVEMMPEIETDLNQGLDPLLM